MNISIINKNIKNLFTRKSICGNIIVNIAYSNLSEEEIIKGYNLENK